jgi:hypothetical protein
MSLQIDGILGREQVYSDLDTICRSLLTSGSDRGVLHRHSCAKRYGVSANTEQIVKVSAFSHHAVRPSARHIACAASKFVGQSRRLLGLVRVPLVTHLERLPTRGCSAPRRRPAEAVML